MKVKEIIKTFVESTPEFSSDNKALFVKKIDNKYVFGIQIFRKPIITIYEKNSFNDRFYNTNGIYLNRDNLNSLMIHHNYKPITVIDKEILNELDPNTYKIDKDEVTITFLSLIHQLVKPIKLINQAEELNYRHFLINIGYYQPKTIDEKLVDIHVYSNDISYKLFKNCNFDIDLFENCNLSKEIFNALEKEKVNIYYPYIKYGYEFDKLSKRYINILRKLDDTEIFMISYRLEELIQNHYHYFKFHDIHKWIEKNKIPTCYGYELKIKLLFPLFL